MKADTTTNNASKKKDKKEEEFIDLTGLKPSKRPKTGVSSTLGDNSSDGIIMEYVSEDKGLEPIEDEYKKYDPEESADELLINQGALIIRSEITITDSAGRNRTLVRRSK